MLTEKFKISSLCLGGSDDTCVACRKQNERIEVINSRVPETKISFTEIEWSSFLAGVKNNEFDI
jgi:hypothetical protein